MNADARRAEAARAGRIERRGSTAPAPLSFAQERLWFLEQFQSGGAVYNVPLSLDLMGAVNIDALSRSLNDIVARHESLRTTFPLVEGRPAQVVAPLLELQLPVIQCVGRSEADRREQARQLAVAEARRPFDLARGPLIRATLFVVDRQRSLLLIVMHHAVADAWSAGILTREISAFYQAHCMGRRADLPPLPVQYADYAVWQRTWLQSERLAKSLDYWKKQLAGSPATLELPADRPRTARESADGAMVEFDIPAHLRERVRALAGSERATLFMAALAVFITLLHRYSGQTDLTVGTPIANRNRSEIEGIVGLFLNTLVLRTRLDDDPSFRQLLRRVRETCIGAYTHQDLPFEYLVQELQPERNLGANPLFQVLFVLQGLGDPGQAPANRAQAQAHSTAAPIPVGTETAKFDLSLYLTDTGQDVLGGWEYRSDLFEVDTLRRMSMHFLTLLEGALADPDRPLSALPLVSEAEWHDMQRWNASAVTKFTDACPHELFEAQAAASPDAPALIFDGEQVSYDQLNRRSNHLARRLRALGVGSEVPVGICVERSVEMVVGLLGILKAGGVHVPLDPAFPMERLAFMISDAGFPVILTQQHLVSRLPADDTVTIVRLDIDAAGIAAERDDNLERVVGPDNLVYILYTSGSTGRPKGAGLCQATLASLIEWQNRITPMAPLARTLQFMSFSFDVSFIEIFSTLSMGGTLVLIREEVRQDVSALAGVLQEQRVERAFFPFTALQQLAKHCAAEPLDLCLKDVISTGEPLVITQDVARFFSDLGGCRLHNAYGPTETHWVSCYTLPAVDPLSWPPLPSIGRCVDNAEIFILDDNLQPLPVGVPGDLYAGGLCLARCYHRRPALTAERFIPHPFSKRSGARLYRTGDRARFRADGTIEYLGRLDTQVKIRGFRVEVGEVEVVLSRHPEVEEAVVTARRLQAGDDNRLIAYVKPRAGSLPSVETLRGYLAQHLAGYMVPSIFVFVDAFPLGATGKIDRRQLPDPQMTRPNLRRVYVAPRNPTEEQLVRIWADVLHIEKVGVEDNFFDLGGHSLLATQVVSRIRDALEVEVPVRIIFESPTIAELMNAIMERQIDSLDDAEVAELLREIDLLSDDEVRSELADAAKP
jgi:amino acid adenylation domain-containing protein